MPDFGAPIAQEVNVSASKGVQTLSDLMGLQQKQIAIQTGQAIQQRAQAEAQGAQQQMATRQRITQATQSGVDDQGNSLRLPNGDLDPAKLVSFVTRIDPAYGPQIASNVIQAHSDRIAVQSAALGLDSKQRQTLQGPLQALALDPSDENLKTASDTINGWVAQHPEMKPVADSASRLLSHVQNAQDPKQRAKLANSLSAMFQPGQAVETQPAGATQVTGQEIQAGTVAPPVAGGGFTRSTGTPATIGPGEVERIEQDPVSGQAIIVRRGPSGTIVSARPAAGLGGGGGGPPQTGAPPQAGGFTPIPPGETVDTLKQLQAQRAASNAAARSTGAVASNNKQILGLLDSGTTTGSNAQFLREMLSSVGLQWTNNEGKNLDQIAHYLSLQQQANETAMGVRTDAGREVSGLASGSITMSTDALKSAVKANDALNTGTSVFNTGLEKAIASRGVPAARQFQNEWAQNFDPTVYRYSNAIRDGDQAEQARIEKQYGKPAAGKTAAPDSAWGRFVGKMKALDSLENTGALPPPKATPP